MWQGVIDSEWLAVECTGIASNGIEISAIQHEISMDVADSRLPHISKQLPKSLGPEIRVAIAIDNEVALQYPIEQLPILVNFSAPVICRAQQIERGIGGQQLHDGSRAEGLVGQMTD